MLLPEQEISLFNHSTLLEKKGSALFYSPVSHVCTYYVLIIEIIITGLNLPLNLTLTQVVTL